MQRAERLQGENVGATDRREALEVGGRMPAHVDFLLYRNPTFCIRIENFNPSA